MNDWNDLATAWQTAHAPVDVETLAASAQRGRRRQQGRFAVEVIAAVAVAAFWLPQLVHGGAGVRLLGVGSIACVVIWCLLLWQTMRGTWSSSSQTAAAYLALEVARLRAARRWAGIVRGFVVVMVVAFVAVLPLLVREGGAIYRAAPWRVVVGVGVFFAVCAGMWIVSGRRRGVIDAQLAAAADDRP